jgi:hypothetical protein
MSDYRPDRWVIVKIITDKECLYKVFASWSERWKINSGIVHATRVADRWEFAGYSGSVYSCLEGTYGTSAYGGTVLQGFVKEIETVGARIEIMPADTDWAAVPYDALQQFVDAGVNRV